jgi:hypothetical protein
MRAASGGRANLRSMLGTWWEAVERWGATDDEVHDTWPCDALAFEADLVVFRAVTVDAPVTTVFRWLCQLRVAPYSYDWIDNLGRRSPRALTPGLDDLRTGQRFMTIFRLDSFVPGDHITLTSDTRAFGFIGGTYRVRPLPGDRSRLAVKLRVRSPSGLHGRLSRAVLPAGDLIMMRRQLLNLAHLAATTARSDTVSPR